MVSNPLESYIWSIGSSISNLPIRSWSMLIGGYMMYNLPLKLILDELTEINSKLALLVENQPIDKPIDMLEEMRMEEEKEIIKEVKEKNGRTIRRKDKQKRS